MPYKDKNARKEWNRKWAMKNRARFKDYNTWWKKSIGRYRKMGITLEQFEAVKKAQGGVCAICGKSDLCGRRLAIDHDHVTGKIRGLLCGMCNTAIGKLGDSVEGVAKALAYLQKHEATVENS